MTQNFLGSPVIQVLYDAVWIFRQRLQATAIGLGGQGGGG